MEHDPVSLVTPHYYIDKWRTNNEVGVGLKRRGSLCFPGRGGCNEYHFPHRRGSGYCRHNKSIAEEQLREREE